MKFKKSKKIFIHVDCDSFFAECEILKNPQLKNDYVLVGEEIVLACNYKTKALGIKTGTPVWQAKEILGDKGFFLKSDHDFYSLVSSKMMKYLEENTLSIEVFSIDEAFCEVSGLAELNNISLEAYIKKLQRDIMKNIGVPISIGVSTTRIKAKIFSKLNKPKGIFIDTGDSRDVYKNLELKIVPFIGPSMQKRLKYKCENVYDFIKLGYWYLKKEFGKSACELWLELSGVDVYIVKKSKLSKSISRGRSFNKHITNNRDFLYKELLKNFNHLYEEFSMKGFETKKVSIFFRDKQKFTHIYHYNLPEYSFLRKELLQVVQKLFLSYHNPDLLYRSTGVVFGSLKEQDFHQMSIFQDKNRQENNNLDLLKVVNELNTKFDNHKLCFGSDLLNSKFRSKLGFRK